MSATGVEPGNWDRKSDVLTTIYTTTHHKLDQHVAESSSPSTQCHLVHAMRKINSHYLKVRRTEVNMDTALYASGETIEQQIQKKFLRFLTQYVVILTRCT